MGGSCSCFGMEGFWSGASPKARLIGRVEGGAVLAYSLCSDTRNRKTRRKRARLSCSTFGGSLLRAASALVRAAGPRGAPASAEKHGRLRRWFPPLLSGHAVAFLCVEGVVTAVILRPEIGGRFG